MKIVVYGLSVTSSWGNGHATTYRSLLKALAARGHTTIFVEKDVEWYRNNRDMPEPTFCSVRLYEDWTAERAALLALADDADAVVVGSYFPDAIAVSQALFTRAKAPVLFYDIDTPVTMARLRAEGRTEYLDAAMIPAYAAYLSFTSGPALQELVAHFGARRADALFCSVDPEIYRPLPGVNDFRADLSYLGTYAVDRQPKLMNLLNAPAEQMPESRFLVAGPQYPGDTTWAANVRRIYHLEPKFHPQFYSSSRFTLNLTRADMVAAGYSPSVRLFEASACGAAIVSDYWPGLEEFLTPGEEILLARETAEVVRILRETGEQERMALGRRARERVLAEHSADHRATRFEQIVSECR